MATRASGTSGPANRALSTPVVTPIAFTTRSDGGLAVEVQQVARSLDGTPLGEARVVHVYAFRDDLGARMDLANTDRGRPIANPGFAR
jgi:hypothetical protein